MKTWSISGFGIRDSGFGIRGRAYKIVIPAKAGIHFALQRAAKITMDPGFRRDDENWEPASAAVRPLVPTPALTPPAAAMRDPSAARP
jgi:hypothetical protein